MSTTECSEVKEVLEQRFESAIPITGIRSMHSAIPSSVNSIDMKILSILHTSNEFQLVLKKRHAKLNKQPKSKRFTKTVKKWTVSTHLS